MSRVLEEGKEGRREGERKGGKKEEREPGTEGARKRGRKQERRTEIDRNNELVVTPWCRRVGPSAPLVSSDEGVIVLLHPPPSYPFTETPTRVLRRGESGRTPLLGA